MANRLLLTSTFPESLLHITYPVAHQALKHVIDTLGYHDWFDNHISVTTDFKTWSKTTDETHAAQVRGNRVRAMLKPNVNPSTIKWEASGTTTALANGNTPAQNQTGVQTSQRRPWADGMHVSTRMSSIFRDDMIGVDLSERSVGSSLSMEVKMEFEDEFVANEALSRIYQCFTNGDMINYVDLMYDYPIPENMLTILKYLYHLKMLSPSNPKGGFTDETQKIFDAQSWFQWLQKYSNEAITYLFNRNHDPYHEIVVNKNHFQALYLIECSQETPDVLQPKGAGITFNLTVQYSRSNLLALEYPVIVNNNYVEQKFVPMERQYRTAGPESMVLWQNPALTALWHKTYTCWPPKPFMFPFWDPWQVPIDGRAWKNGYRPVLICALTLDNPEDPNATTKIDLDVEIEKTLESKLDLRITDCIRLKKNKVFGVDEFVNITVYADDIAIYDKSMLDISDGHTLTIKNKYTQPIYRMVISIAPPVEQYRHEWNRVWITSIITHKEKA